ncbi:MAG: TRAP transporter substrate-binding protein [Paracoccaceae bacterium]|nr:TRAP transporter substrate-binding protein [Paracoccaceae bacterium]
MLKKLGLTAATALALAFTSQYAAAEELSVATFVPPTHESNVGVFAWFGEEIEKRSGGTLTMKLYPAGQLGSGPVQQYKRAVEGVGDITFGLAALTPTLFPKTMLAILPGKATDGEDSTRRIWAVYDEYLADEWSDVKLLALGTAAGSVLVGNRDVSTLEGMQGAKVVPFANTTIPMLQGMGAVPVALPVDEHYTGLSTGLIDAVVTTLNNLMPPWNLDDVVDYAVVNTPATFQVAFIAMNRERYEGLSDEHRAIIDEIAGLPMSLELAASFQHADDMALDWVNAQLDSGDMNFEWIVVSDEERAKMEDALLAGMEEIYADYTDRGIGNAQEIYEALNQ